MGETKNEPHRLILPLYFLSACESIKALSRLLNSSRPSSPAKDSPMPKQAMITSVLCAVSVDSSVGKSRRAIACGQHVPTPTQVANRNGIPASVL